MMRISKHQHSSLEELEGEKWSEPINPTRLVAECHRLRRVELRSMTVENLRLLIGQGIGLDYLIPIALTNLRANALAAGDHYEGGLLCSVLRSKREFWDDKPKWAKELDAIAGMALRELDPHDKTVRRAIEESLDDFRSGGKRGKKP